MFSAGVGVIDPVEPLSRPAGVGAAFFVGVGVAFFGVGVGVFFGVGVGFFGVGVGVFFGVGVGELIGVIVAEGSGDGTCVGAIVGSSVTEGSLVGVAEGSPAGVAVAAGSVTPGSCCMPLIPASVAFLRTCVQELSSIAVQSSKASPILLFLSIVINTPLSELTLGSEPCC